MNEKYTIEQFTNHLNKIVSDFMYWEITKISNKNDVNLDESFLKWQKSSEQDICQNLCHCEFGDDSSDYYIDGFECKTLDFPYYIQQRDVGFDGDSFSGELVYELDKYYVFMSYEM